jgi:hypothetical protein
MITSLGLPRFSRGNSKLPDSTLTFSLPAGHTCPGARACRAMADRATGKITDGDGQLFRCYEASIENFRPAVRSNRWRNYDLLRGVTTSTDMAELLLAGIAAARDHKATHVRWFTGGDLYSRTLLQGVLKAAEGTPELSHYFYSKSLALLAPGHRLIAMPTNVRVTASYGGVFDQMIRSGVFPRTARVVNTYDEAARYTIPIDFNDRLAWQDEPTHFCHLTHGSQRPGSAAGRAIRHRRDAGDFTGYGSATRPHA